jgi:hypothetical protein
VVVVAVGALGGRRVEDLVGHCGGCDGCLTSRRDCD